MLYTREEIPDELLKYFEEVETEETQHFAVFPDRIAETIISTASRPGDTVLDPFNGAGTSGEWAVRLGRNYIGVDLSQKYLDMTAERLEKVQVELPIKVDEGAMKLTQPKFPEKPKKPEPEDLMQRML